MVVHCCKRMSENLKHQCDQHDDPFDCPDYILHYVKKLKEYGIVIHDGGSSYIVIKFCPWCGSKLPESLREKDDH